MGHPNADAVRAAYQAFSSGDLEAVANFIAEDSVWHISASGALSGDYKGRDEVLGFLGRLMEETEGSFRTDVHDVVAGDDHAVALLTANSSRHGRSISVKQSAIYHMVDGRSTEAWFFYDDAAAVNELFS